MPKAAFQFGVKMQDGRKTRKQNKDQKLNNELHKINQIMDKKKKEKPGSFDEPSHFDEEIQPGKRLRVQNSFIYRLICIVANIVWGDVLYDF